MPSKRPQRRMLGREKLRRFGRDKRRKMWAHDVLDSVVLKLPVSDDYIARALSILGDMRGAA